MPRNGSGTYAPTASSVAPAVASTIIDPSDFNDLIDDIADELTNSVAADGQTSMTGPLKAADGTASAPSLTFASDTNTGFYRKSADTIGVACNGVEVAAFGTSGLVLPAAGGLTGLQATSFTPTLSFATNGDFSPTGTTYVGRYTRLFNMIFFLVDMTFTTNAYTTASGNLQVGNLPVAAVSGITQAVPVALFEIVNTSANARELQANIAAGATTMTFAESIDAGASTAITTSQVAASTAGFRLVVQGFYFV